jgi:ATP-dependent DNA helicase RecQ
MLAHPPSTEALLDTIGERLERREASETQRVQRVLDLVEQDGCQVKALVAYFGEKRAEPCGHCSFCIEGARQQVAPASPRPPINALVERAEIASIAQANPEALGEPRQLARYLCGISSPATIRARLTREPPYGSLEGHRFGDVLAWCRASPGRP